MAIKERHQNPVVGDTVNLKMFAYNSHARTDFVEIEKVEIYFLDKSETNPDGRVLVASIDGDQVTHTETGLYQLSLPLPDPTFTIGGYLDVWHVVIEENEPPVRIDNTFHVYPDLWYTSPIPIIYDFSFAFRPNKIRKGSKKWIIIEITPNVPNTTDLRRYYEQLAIVSPLQVSVEQACGDCLPPESDLRLLIDEQPVELREKGLGYFLLDTTDMAEGIYNVWFTLSLGESVHLSDKQQLQIF